MIMIKRSIKDMPIDDRPRERLKSIGVEHLSAIELLAIIIKTGTRKKTVLELAQEIVTETGGLDQLINYSVEQLQEFSGIGQAKAMQIMAGIELGKRGQQEMLAKKDRKLSISNPEDCFYALAHRMKYLEQEHFVVLYLDTKQRVIKEETIFIGTIDYANIHPREIFKGAVKHLASSIICAHNHPSGDLTPSRADLLVTKQLVEAGIMMGIPVIDHLIIGGDEYVSLRSLGHIEG